MATLADLRARIADDLARDDLATQIADAIRDAVRRYEGERFWFNEFWRATATLSASSQSLALASLPIAPVAVGRVRLRIGNGVYSELRRENPAYTATAQDQGQAAEPTAWCVAADSLQFDVRANRDYALLLDGVRKLSTASAATDTSVWVNDARDLIRAAAEKALYLDVIKDAEQAAVCAAREAEALAMLRARSNVRAAGRSVRSSWF